MSVSTSENLVQLDRDHPGFRDPIYRARRDAIARLAIDHREGAAVPDVAYTDDEQGVWRAVWRQLGPEHEARACDAYRRCAQILPLSRETIPQLREVNASLGPAGFAMIPVAGLVTSPVFLEHLSRGRFLSTQYVRHHTRPLYTPEPDVIHELVGHAVTLIDPAFARLNRAFGEAFVRGRDPEALTRVYWYSLEFGVVRERGALRAYGAGLLSSFGELGRFETETKLLPFDVQTMAATPFDPTDYQHVLFVASGLDEVIGALSAWLEG